jgi:DNA-binding CsgD family transcriptional regulator
MKDLDLQSAYADLLAVQIFDEADLDYSLLERHKPLLAQLAAVSNSGITVFDLHARRHVFASCNYIDWFGYYVDGIDDRIHPDDRRSCLRNGTEGLRFLYAHKEQINDLKMVSEYRIRNASGGYVRVIEQFSLLASDKSGNAWLALSVLDLSPDQSVFRCATGCLMNCRTRTFFPIRNSAPAGKKPGLSPREIKILQLIKDGLLSKEISDRLSISVHTVNTHRQRILEKLQADNSMEAVKYAAELGLLC